MLADVDIPGITTENKGMVREGRAAVTLYVLVQRVELKLEAEEDNIPVS